jgi:protein tyrosine/serine phosphatase
MTLFPPFLYAIVNDDIYRGGYIKERNVQFMKRLQLNSVISLTPKPLLDLKVAANMIHIPVDKPKESIPLIYAQVNKILQVINENTPCYIHCIEGTITNLVVMCYRKAQGWDLKSIISEAQRFKEVGTEEIQFVEKFNIATEKKADIAKESEPFQLSRTILALDLEMG